MRITQGQSAVAGLVLGFAATAAQAQPADGFYGGLGLSFSHAESDAGTGTGASDAGLTGLSLLVGNRWRRGGYSLGLELDTDLSFGGGMDPAPSGDCLLSADGDYMCEHDATVRLRGVAATQIGGSEIFGAVGLGAAFGSFADSATTNQTGSVYGLSVGAGVSYPLRDNLTLRGEVNYDNFSETGQGDGSADYEAVSARVMAVFNF